MSSCEAKQKFTVLAAPMDGRLLGLALIAMKEINPILGTLQIPLDRTPGLTGNYISLTGVTLLSGVASLLIPQAVSALLPLKGILAVSRPFHRSSQVNVLARRKDERKATAL